MEKEMIYKSRGFSSCINSAYHLMSDNMKGIIRGTWLPALLTSLFSSIAATLFIPNDETLAFGPWPTWNEEALKEDTIQIPVQVNGKVRATVEVGVNEEQASVLEKAHAMKNVQAWMEGKTVVKEIYVKGRIVNIVVK